MIGQRIDVYEVLSKLGVGGMDSLLDESLNRQIGADFATHLIKASYSRRF